MIYPGPPITLAYRRFSSMFCTESGIVRSAVGFVKQPVSELSLSWVPAFPESDLGQNRVLPLLSEFSPSLSYSADSLCQRICTVLSN